MSGTERTFFFGNEKFQQRLLFDHRGYRKKAHAGNTNVTLTHLLTLLYQEVTQRLGPYINSIGQLDKISLRTDKLGVKVSASIVDTQKLKYC